MNGYPRAVGFFHAEPERYVPIPEGEAGSRATLGRMALFIRTPQPRVQAFVEELLDAPALAPLTDTERCAFVFNWVRQHMLYTPDYNDGVVVEEIRTPGTLLDEIARLGRALGDCDDYVVLLGAVYHAMGYGVTIVAVGTQPDGQLDHVYLLVDSEDGRYAADGIVGEPFGWEVPSEEQTARLEWPV